MACKFIPHAPMEEMLSPECASADVYTWLSLKSSHGVRGVLPQLDMVLAKEPARKDALLFKAGLLLEMNRPGDALANLDRVLAQEPHSGQALYNRAVVLSRTGSFGAALDSVEAALKVRPNHATSHVLRGDILRKLNRNDDALDSIEHGIKLDGRRAEYLNNRALVLSDLGDYANALSDFNDALCMRPDFAEAINNRAVLLSRLGQVQEALIDFSRAIAVAPQYYEAHFNESLCRLSSGDYELGWRKYEYRRLLKNCQTVGGSKIVYAQSVGDLQEKRVVVYAEQGLGDSIQFIRYVPALKSIASHIYVRVQPSLATLVGRAFKSESISVNQGDVSSADVACSLLSLPFFLWSKLPKPFAARPYLRPDRLKCELWRRRLGPGDRFRVGLVISGSSTHSNDRQRSVPAQVFVPLLRLNVEYVCLQTTLRPDDRRILAAFSNVRLVDNIISDFDDTASLIEIVDLVITVDTSVAHLAGAMGKPVWILVPGFNTDWRWRRGETRTPWYPSATLFRRPVELHWEATLERVAHDLVASFC